MRGIVGRFDEPPNALLGHALLPAGLKRPLPAPEVGERSRGDADVEGFDAGVHRQGHLEIAFFEQEVGDAFAFAAHYQCGARGPIERGGVL